MRRSCTRKFANVAALALSVAATGVGLFFLGAILWTLLKNGLAGMSPQLFTQMTPPPGAAGGLLNAIFGSAVMTLIGIAVGRPGGRAGRHLPGRIRRQFEAVGGHPLRERRAAECALDHHRLVRLPDRRGADGAFLRHRRRRRRWQSSPFPVTVRTTEDMLRLVPQGMKDASTALGAYPWRTTLSVIYPAARSGILTGLLLAIARVSGETAPLLFTALNNQFWSRDLNAPMANLPVDIYLFAQSPYPEWQQLAWSGALLITLTILALSIFARIVVSALQPARRT